MHGVGLKVSTAIQSWPLEDSTLKSHNIIRNKRFYKELTSNSRQTFSY